LAAVHAPRSVFLDDLSATSPVRRIDNYVVGCDFEVVVDGETSRAIRCADSAQRSSPVNSRRAYWHKINRRLWNLL